MKNVLFLLFVIVFFMNGCTTDPEVQKIRMDSRVLVTLKENISEEGRKLILDCKTDSIYPCSDYGIAYQFQRNGDVYDINFTHVVETQNCTTGAGPATIAVDLGTLPHGTYTLRILVNESVLQPSLSVTSDYYKLNDTSNSWVEILNPEIKRIPENAIWGHVGFSSDSFVVKQVPLFFDTLKALGVQELQLVPGDYSYFEVDSSGTMSQPANPGTENAIPFAYIYTNEITNLREYIKRLGKSSPLSVALFTTKGDIFYTWQLAGEP